MRQTTQRRGVQRHRLRIGLALRRVGRAAATVARAGAAARRVTAHAIYDGFGSASRMEVSAATPHRGTAVSAQHGKRKFV